jgi:hypothetical protein
MSPKKNREALSRVFSDMMIFLVHYKRVISIIIDVRGASDPHNNWENIFTLAEFFGDDRDGLENYYVKNDTGYGSIKKSNNLEFIDNTINSVNNEYKQFYVSKNEKYYPGSVFRNGKVVILCDDSTGSSFSRFFIGDHLDRNIGSNTIVKIIGDIDGRWKSMTTDNYRLPVNFDSPLLTGPLDGRDILKSKELVINDPNPSAGSYDGSIAMYGPTPIDPISGNLVLAIPIEANIPLSDDLTGKIVLIKRGLTTFVTKTRNAQQAGAIAVVIYNNKDGNHVSTTLGDDSSGTDITIPTIFISENSGDLIIANLPANGTIQAKFGPANPLIMHLESGNGGYMRHIINHQMNINPKSSNTLFQNGRYDVKKGAFLAPDPSPKIIGLSGGNALPNSYEETVHYDFGYKQPHPDSPLMGWTAGGGQPDPGDNTTWRDRWLEQAIHVAMT